MQGLSFDVGDPVFEFNNLRFSVQVFTFENVYGLDRDACVMTHDEHTCTIHCEQFTWAGGQQHAAGSVTISAVAGEGTTTFAIEAETTHHSLRQTSAQSAPTRCDCQSAPCTAS